MNFMVLEEDENFHKIQARPTSGTKLGLIIQMIQEALQNCLGAIRNFFEFPRINGICRKSMKTSYD